MTKNSIPTVSVVCPCGATFSREVKRGRPQVWCPTCVQVPFAQRVAGAPQPVVTEAGEVVEAPAERVVNQWDPHDAIRAQIEANVAAVYAGWSAVAAAMRADGASDWDVADAQRVALTEAYKSAGAM